MMTDIINYFPKKYIHEDYIPNVNRIFHKAKDPITLDEIRIRVT